MKQTDSGCKMLSKAEQQISSLLLQGFSNQEIADRAFVSEKTVKFHLTNIYKKENVSSRCQYILKKVGREEMKDVSTNTNLPAPSRMDSDLQKEKVEFIDKKFDVTGTIKQLHYMMTEVTKDQINPNTVNAACNCVTRLNETIDTAIRAARFLGER